jgi:hypothetical protein
MAYTLSILLLEIIHKHKKLFAQNKMKTKTNLSVLDKIAILLFLVLMFIAGSCFKIQRAEKTSEPSVIISASSSSSFDY